MKWKWGNGPFDFRNIGIGVFIAVVTVNSFGYSSPEPTAPPASQSAYYDRLKQNEFLTMMIPKEEFLLGIIQCVKEEIASRRREGVNLSDLGFQETVSPQDALADRLVVEYESLVDVLNEIDRLETKAKQQVDLESLMRLAGLRKRIRDFAETSVPMPNDSTVKSQPANLTTGGYDQGGSLADELTYVRILDFKRKLTEYEFYRARLLSTANDNQAQRMFQGDLRRALESYSTGNFSLSRLQLHNILSAYTRFRKLDDVMFYAAESSYGLNLLDEALGGYQRLAQDYPQSSFKLKALEKMIFIHYVYGQINRMNDRYQDLMARAADPGPFGTVSYLVGYAYFKNGEYPQAIAALKKVGLQSLYHASALYLTAACHSNLGEDDAAVAIYQDLILTPSKSDPMLAQIQNNALLKLGLIYNNRAQYDLAMSYFNKVSRQSEHYDLSLIGKAWGAFRSGRPGESLQNAEWVLKYSLASRYAYEARVLAARCKEMLGQPEEAAADFIQVYRAQKAAKSTYIPTGTKSVSSQMLEQMLESEKDLIGEQEMNTLGEVAEIRQFLYNSGPVSGDTDPAVEKEMVSLNQKIAKLDSLELAAKDKKQPGLLEEIRRLRAEMLSSVRDRSSQSAIREAGDDPLIRRMGLTEYLKYLFHTLLSETLREKEKTGLDIAKADSLIKLASGSDQSDLVFRMEMRKEELQDYYGRLNQYEVWLREHSPQEERLELDRWAMFSGYGISNISFSRIRETEERIGELSKSVDMLNRVFQTKRKRLDARINNLLADVEKIENQMKLEAVDKEQKEKDRMFKTDYFDKQSREAPAGELKEKPESNAGGSR